MSKHRFRGGLKTHLSSSVDLCLPCVLSLTEHCRCHELVAVLPTDKVGRLEEDGGAVAPGHGLPLGFRSERTIDGSSDGSFVGFVVCAEMLGVVGGERLFCEFACLDLKISGDDKEVGFLGFVC